MDVIYNKSLDLYNFTITLLKKEHNINKFSVVYKPTREEFFICYNSLKKDITKIILKSYYTNKHNTIISTKTHRKYANCIIDIYNNNFLLINIFNFLSKI